MVAVKKSHLTRAEASLAMLVTEHQLRVAEKRGIITPPRLGRYTVFPSDQLDTYRTAMEGAKIAEPRPAVAAALVAS